MYFHHLAMVQVGTAVDELLDKKNHYPYIIALGLSHKEIVHYYIALEKEIIDVSFYL